jgi:hypothetical protein
VTTRRSLLVTFILFAPLALVGLGLEGYLLWQAVADGAGSGDVILMIFVGFVTLLLLFQALTALLDLRSEPVRMAGRVSSRWSRSDLLIFGDSCYIRVSPDGGGSSAIFKIERFWWEQLKEGDPVLIEHYRHTSSVVSVEKAPS